MQSPLLEPTVFIVDDDLAVRDSLSLLLNTFGLTTQTFHSAESFLAFWTPDVVGCLILDINMPGLSGFGMQEALEAQGISIPVIFITGHGDLSTCRRAFHNGADDFLTKPLDDTLLIQSVRKAIQKDIKQKQLHLSSESSKHLMERLTERELDVLRLIMEGHPNKLIARQLDLSTRTVEAHRARIMEKMEVKSFAHLIRTAVLAELIENTP